MLPDHEYLLVTLFLHLLLERSAEVVLNTSPEGQLAENFVMAMITTFELPSYCGKLLRPFILPFG